MIFIKLFFLIVLLSSFTSLHAQVRGCTDPLATNYNASATVNDGSCMYSAISISPLKSLVWPAILRETSGLLLDGDSVWTHNDDSDTHLYRFSLNDTAYTSITIAGVQNIEWEDMTGDSSYIYLGDFGNNASGNRKDLHILRIHKNEMKQGIMKIDTIHFSYEDQKSFEPIASNTTDYDCEAMMVDRDSIYLFSKMWSTQKTIVYALPKIPGTYTAMKKGSIDVQGLITGATILQDKKLIILCGYSTLLQPFLYLLYDYPAHDFHAGNKRKVALALPFHQIEGITTHDGKMIYCSNERFTQSVINIPQGLHHIDISSVTTNYLSGGATHIEHRNTDYQVSIVPNPAHSTIIIHARAYIGSSYRIANALGETVHSGIIEADALHLQLSHLPIGMYNVILKDRAIPFVIMR